ncbi:hypothetical protein FEM48_Zijuj09G0105700 [Ziziphus jujuba var. spinosa]|uniref:BURP domain-containing protein n=1 Tax=Ziziphus jujuba var. spinosa TaxID=714518 RepID=A0A978USH8_ZIZJJ|nr:hypothetical protein FEM48_Zijuj09G0105700 [Ziziphus jujuba var. spinosa]
MNQLPNLLQFFSFSPDSLRAKAMEDTLNHYETKPIKGDTKFCATSLESMLDFTRGVLGLDSPFSVVTTESLSNSNVSFQNYTILELPKEISASKMVACGEHGEKAEAVAVCRMDTPQWNSDHTPFCVHGIEPGTSPVCHFFPADSFVWIPAPAASM